MNSAGGGGGWTVRDHVDCLSTEILCMYLYRDSEAQDGQLQAANMSSCWQMVGKSRGRGTGAEEMWEGRVKYWGWGGWTTTREAKEGGGGKERESCGLLRYNSCCLFVMYMIPRPTEKWARSSTCAVRDIRCYISIVEMVAESSGGNGRRPVPSMGSSCRP